MTPSVARFSTILALLLVSFWIPHCSSVTEAEVNAICTKSRNSSLCFSFLKSNPGLRAAKLADLCKRTIETAEANAGMTLQKIEKLISRAIDPRQKELLRSCSEHYGEAIGDLQGGSRDVAARDFQGVNLAASGAFDNGNDCQDELRGTNILNENNRVLGDYCDIIMVIANRLP